MQYITTQSHRSTALLANKFVFSPFPKWLQGHTMRKSVDSIAKHVRYSGRRKAAEEDGDPGTPGKGIWSRRCG